MDIIQKARESYVTRKQGNQISTACNERQTLDDDIHRYISIAVKSIPSAERLFTNPCVFQSLINALLLCISNDTDVFSVARAYQSVEKYFCLLVEQPWKLEYRTLKTYGGFYKTKVKAVLADAEEIFVAAGYTVDLDDKMVYRKQEVEKRTLVILSFDCFVASEICIRIADQHNQLKTVGKTLDDAVFDILQKSWPRDIARERMSQKKSASKVIPPPELPKREPLSNGVSGKRISAKEVIYPAEPSISYSDNINRHNLEESLGNFKYKHIPFMDEDEHYPQLSEATPEEHIRESMKLVQQQKKMSEPLSDNWKYTPEAVPGTSNPESARTYPPGPNIATYLYQQVPKQNLFNKDELDITPPLLTKSNLNMSTHYTTSFPPSRSVASDQGYSTGPGYSNQSQISSNQDMLSETIYRPPSIHPGGNIIPVRQYAVPPPIPSRGLKPVYMSKGGGEDVVDGCYVTAEPRNNQRNKVAIPSSVVNPAVVAEINAELRPQRSLQQIKSSSLNSQTKKLNSDNRITKSMDYSLQPWICPLCSMRNSSLDKTCISCGNAPGEPKKSCQVCTFLNPWQMTSCEMCHKALPEEVIYKE